MYPKVLYLLAMVFLSSCSLFETEVILNAEDVTYIYDGDTVTFRCIEGFKCENNKIQVRVKGVDAPEIKAECKEEKLLARQAKQHTVRTLRDAKQIKLIIDYVDVYDRYDRLLAYVYVDGIGLHKSLIKRGYGREYHGGKRVSWCR